MATKRRMTKHIKEFDCLIAGFYCEHLNTCYRKSVEMSHLRFELGRRHFHETAEKKERSEGLIRAMAA